MMDPSTYFDMPAALASGIAPSAPAINMVSCYGLSWHGSADAESRKKQRANGFVQKGSFGWVDWQDTRVARSIDIDLAAKARAARELPQFSLKSMPPSTRRRNRHFGCDTLGCERFAHRPHIRCHKELREMGEAQTSVAPWRSAVSYCHENLVSRCHLAVWDGISSDSSRRQMVGLVRKCGCNNMVNKRWRRA